MGAGSTGASASVSPPGPCPKCGSLSDHIGTAWHTNQWSCTYGQRDAWGERGANGEHLHRTCYTCGFHWGEPTHDQRA